MVVFVYAGSSGGTRDNEAWHSLTSLFPQELETLDNGKPYAISYSVDLPNVVKCLR